MPSLLQGLPVARSPLAARAGQAAAWRLGLPILRSVARRRVGNLQAGAVTVVTVNWNSLAHLQVLVDRVRRCSPPDLRIIVVDNGSQDGSREWLRRREDLRALLLPVNVGHDAAIDAGVLLCATEFFIALDVDAFPLDEGWMSALLSPLSAGAQIAGARLNRQYVHPCCLAMRTRRFIERSHSFRSNYRPRADGRDASGDVGEAMSALEAPALHFLEVTSQRGPGDLGTIFGGIVYHNFYATRFRATTANLLDGSVVAEDAERAWNEAVRRWGG